jgi:hypothetical protein
MARLGPREHFGFCSNVYHGTTSAPGNASVVASSKSRFTHVCTFQIVF